MGDTKAEAKIEIITNIREIADFIPDNDDVRVLVVFDMDDVLVRGQGSLGSDTWFRKCIDKGREGIQILRDMGTAYSLMDYHTVEPDTREVLEEVLKRDHVDYMIMTSRGSMYYSQTIKHLRDAGLGDLMIRPNMVDVRTANDLLPKSVDPNDPPMYPRLTQARYIDNICLAAGNDKGEVMEEIIFRSKKQYGRIVFIDDSISNVNKVHNRFVAPLRKKVFDGINTYTIHYSYMEVEKRHYDDSALARDDQKLRYLKNTREYLNGRVVIDYPLTINILFVISVFWWIAFRFLGFVSC